MISLPFEEAGASQRGRCMTSLSACCAEDHPWTDAASDLRRAAHRRELLLLGEGHCFRLSGARDLSRAAQQRRAAARARRQLAGDHPPDGGHRGGRHRARAGGGRGCRLPEQHAGRGAPVLVRQPSRRVALAWRVTYPRSRRSRTCCARRSSTARCPGCGRSARAGVIALLDEEDVPDQLDQSRELA